ncbi:DNA recombination protein RmuC [Wolbachia endosymbiont of Dirofilaria (Dirofilaria) immitis]|uniref:DNA recombination protein RmuC n=2 Tax=unclassified Wolbachia TaxID=2640676 RepID=UPI00158F131C|nr:DNA recombination protein RmuC [Wolbachia endosymbiont of Dirofilaria (Dirofilaria) immitis]QKX02262.1 DNA recombination protein RmuC [Wolbachia endosymbiont of Dirofilaria (Dirofilaria) immitis]
MLSSFIFPGLSFFFLLLLYYVNIRKNRELNKEKINVASLESTLCKLEHELQEVKQILLYKNEEIINLKVSNAELGVTLRKEREEKKREIELLTEAEKRLTNTFKALSLDALQVNSSNFLSLANEAISSKLRETEGDLKKGQTTINEVVAPIKERLEKFDSEIRELEKERIGAYEGLKEQIGLLINQTSSLANALRKPHIKGKWGEIQLKRVVEMAGMIEYCDFFTQPSVVDKNEDNLLRPDLIIKMPSGKQIIIDAKVPLDSYLDAMSQNDLRIQREKLRSHSLAIKRHISNLSKKEYWNQFKNTPELVVLFLTGEGVFSAALEHEPALIEIGIEKKVIIATPITLIALLRTIAYGWKQEMIAESSKKISELGHILYERICTMGENFDNLRKSLKSSVDYYNKTASSLEARVFPVARKFNKLGVHAKNKELSVVKELEFLPRTLYAEELKVD